jgi:hypothetical protein
LSASSFFPFWRKREMKSSKKNSAELFAKSPKTPNEVDMQRITARRIGVVISELERKLENIEKVLNPDDLTPSFEKLLKDKKLSYESIIELFALCLSKETCVRQKHEALLNAFVEIRYEQKFLQWVANQTHAGGRVPIVYLRSEALKIAQNHFHETGKYLSAKKIRDAVCRNAFDKNTETYLFEFRKKNRTRKIDFADTANPLWLPFTKKYGYLMSPRTVTDWLKKEGLSAPSKKYAKTS